MDIKNHRISGDKIRPFVAATTVGKEIVPEAIVIHYTAGPSGDATVRYFAMPECRRASAHLVVHEDGTVTQMVDFNRYAAHAGESSYGNRKAFNYFSVGIEISNPGYLLKNKEGNFVYQWEYDKPKAKIISLDKIVEGKHRNKETVMRFWHKYTDAQIKTVFELCETLKKAYNISLIVGHEEICMPLGRKQDPGPAFPLDELREKILPKKKEDTPVDIAEKFGITNAKVNFRKTADKNGEKLTAPIPQGTKLQVIGETSEWVQVICPVQGWVFAAYIEDDHTDDKGDAVVKVDMLNIRKDPSSKGELIAPPLSKGMVVFVHTEQNGWAYVTVYMKGWVFKQFINI